MDDDDDSRHYDDDANIDRGFRFLVNKTKTHIIIYIY